MLTRRGFVKLVGGAAVVITLPACGDNIHLAEGAFLDPHQWRTIEAATAVIVPGNVEDPGAREAIVVRYIDQLLGAFDVTPPAIFAGGPASGRQAFPDSAGFPTKTFPENGFATFLPLTRIQEIAWRVRLFGSEATEGGDFNDAILGPSDGLRARYAAGVKALDAAAKAIDSQRLFVQLEAGDQQRALDEVAATAPEFYAALVEHTVEGLFAAPEYGGNQYLQGWELAGYDGDSIPLGHAFYDQTAQRYRDRVDQPTAQPTPGVMTEDFDDATLQLLTMAAIDSGGKRYF